MIPKMHKFVFVGIQEDLDTFFENAQEAGLCQFINKQPKSAAKMPHELEQISRALKILIRQAPQKPKAADPEDLMEIVKRTLGLKKRAEKLEEQHRLELLEMQRVHPLGEFSLEQIEKIRRESGRFVQFFCARHGKITQDHLPQEVIFLGTDQDLDYFMGVSSTLIIHPELTEMHVSKPYQEVREEAFEIQEEIFETERKLRDMAGHAIFVREEFIKRLNVHHLELAKSATQHKLDEALFVIEGWIPETYTKKIPPLLKELAVHCEEVAIAKDDVVPTYMKNEGLAAVGEDLVEIYDIPSIEDHDPSPWLIWFFPVFFAMIIADAGYGLIFALLSIVLWAKFPDLKGSKKRALKLLTIISCTSIVWGVLLGSYFSIKLEPESPLNRITILYNLSLQKVGYHIERKDETFKEWTKAYPDLANITKPSEFIAKGVKVRDGKTTYALMEDIYDTLLLEIALMLGVFHLSLSFLRNLRRHWSGIGWVAFLIGGYLFFPSMLSATSLVNYLGWISKPVARIVGLQLFCSGIGVAVVLALIQHKLRGLEEVLKSIQIFSDTLSYLRLYALGLASMILAATFNEMGEMAGFAFGVIIVLIGHMVNITLAVMAGFIHGLRLNFLEWYHYSFEGGGKKFSPLKLLKSS